MKFTAEVVKQRAELVMSMLQSNPEVTNKALDDALMNKFGNGASSEFFAKCRKSFEKAQKTFGEGAKALGQKNGAIHVSTEAQKPDPEEDVIDPLDASMQALTEHIQAMKPIMKDGMIRAMAFVLKDDRIHVVVDANKMTPIRKTWDF